MSIVNVPGARSREVMLYALSTCGWCHKTKKLLDDLGIEYSYAYVDQLDSDQKKEAVRKIKEWNPACSFPTLVLDNKKCIVGYNEQEIKERLRV